MTNTIVRLGELDMAGSLHYPTTYRINSCPMSDACLKPYRAWLKRRER